MSRTMLADVARDREDAWAELHAARSAGWLVGSPSHHPERDEWLLYAFDPSEGAVMGKRNREWTAIAPTEEAVIRLREIGEGRWPK